jgi:hypothetical protein
MEKNFLQQSVQTKLPGRRTAALNSIVPDKLFLAAKLL